MTYQEIRVNIRSTNGVIRCPRCARRIGRTLQSSAGKDIVVPCFHCKVNWITEINPSPPRPDI